MRTVLSLFSLVLFVAAVAIAGDAVATAGGGVRAAEKVILDSDMVEGFDDGVAMLLLANSPDVELLGVTIVAGNTWVAEGTAHAVRQLEIIGRTDIPVYRGLTRPFRSGRIEGLETERELFGIDKRRWVGCMGRPDPEDWRRTYRELYKREPEAEPQAGHAVQFIIDSVRAHPNEITIAAIGPLGNLALAVMLAPDIAPLIKRVVYMGGAFYQQGNVTPAAEFNFWFDPEAARTVVRSPFREQVFFGLDVCEKVAFTRGHFNAVTDMLGEGELGDFIKGAFVGQHFAASPKFSHYIWDVLAAVSILEPSLVLNQSDAYVDVVQEFGPAYGKSLAFGDSGPLGTKNAVIVTDINKDRFWDMMLDESLWRTGAGTR